MHKLSLVDRAIRRYRRDGFRSLASNSWLRFKTRTAQRVFPHVPWIANFYKPKLEYGSIELTNACNLKCEMCFVRDQRATGYITFDLFRKTVDQFVEVGADQILLNYAGESLLHPRFKECVEYICEKRNGQLISWIDNGMLFNSEIADLIVELGVNRVCFSLDGLDEVNDKIRVGSKYEVIEQNILYLLEKRGKQAVPEVTINMVDYGKSQREIDEFMRVWVPKVEHIILSPCVAPDWTLTNPESYYRDYPVKLAPYCPSLFNTLIVCWDGKVTSCCADIGCKLNIGDVNVDSLKDMWMNRRYKFLRKCALKNSFPEGLPCHMCNWWRREFMPGWESILNGKARLYYEHIRKKYEKVK